MSWQTSIGKNLRELRLILCHTSPRSQGMRDFIRSHYWNVKRASPNFQFIVRECEDADPLVIARYQFGVEKKALTSGLSDKEVEKVVEELVNQADKVNKQL
eukprot:TRINITY_DN0_c1989_g1_i2.p1 TRINITY_DN0_c1989_g1~~TRINITY_DN0_c1989_g1_i2.p1  ORF type:complete len:101 (+),score=26.85 TRINITY_DN0_c1989_g1_i2:45-347(+)